MVKHLQLLAVCILATILQFSSNAQKLGFKELLKKNPSEKTTFCVPSNEKNYQLLEREAITIKFATDNWLFVTATPEWIQEKYTNGDLTNYYFEFAPPSLMSDTARLHHFVDEVHAGAGGLGTAYTGNGVIIGYVDTGADFNHDDFKNSDGSTRIIRFWDQSMPDDVNSPQPYGYGFAWDSTAINNLTCTSMDNQGHGTTVAGQGSGNGSANGQNKGMAPESSIIIVKTSFSRPNWTLTVADACDYIFKVADSLGLPAVVNLSVGSYLGSHDGNDPASEMMEALLDEKPGRIIVGAAGNSGNYGPYHQRSDVTSDTNFVWFANNPATSAQMGANTIFFDLWTDLSEATFDVAMGADTEGPNWDFRGRTAFHGAMSSIGTTIFDTIWNGSNRLATIEIYSNIVGNNLQLQILTRVDSTNYRYRFETTGSGSYDLWSGIEFGFNSMFAQAPPLAEFPDSIYYVAPDKNQSIVSSWNCSEKVVSVGNMRNRLSHIDKNLNTYAPAVPPMVGELSVNSSKGPNRHNVIKPDITAAGDISLATAPVWILMNPAYNAAIDSGGMHGRNGGTSMSAPVVAGIAALYLERCNRASYQDFLDDIHNSAYVDGFTGPVPNNAYGYGKIHALNALLQQTLPSIPTISPSMPSSLVASSGTYFNWLLDGSSIPGENDQELVVTPPYGEYQVEVYNTDGCSSISLPIVVTANLNELENYEVTVFPNPSDNNIEIKLDEVINTAVLINMNGEVIDLKRNSGNNYSLSNVAKGTYTLKINTETGTFYSKIIRL